MVLLRFRDSNDIKEVSIKEANVLIREQKAYLLKPSILVKVLTPKGISEMEYNLAVKDEAITIIEWMSDEDIKKHEKTLKKESKKEINTKIESNETM